MSAIVVVVVLLLIAAARAELNNRAAALSDSTFRVALLDPDAPAAYALWAPSAPPDAVDDALRVLSARRVELDALYTAYDVLVVNNTTAERRAYFVYERCVTASRGPIDHCEPPRVDEVRSVRQQWLRLQAQFRRTKLAGAPASVIDHFERAAVLAVRTYHYYVTRWSGPWH